jgi:cytochrome c oxidase subunit 3
LAETRAVLAHHFDDLEQQGESASLGMWVFLVTEILFFGGLFCVYTIYRWKYPGAFTESSLRLDVLLGGVNTGVLIMSSLTMAMAVRSSQLGRKQALILFLILTIILGSVFLGIKGYEYAQKYYEHLIPGPYFQLAHHPREGQIFFSLYFAMTGVHAFHMIVGVGLITWLIVKAAKNRFSPEYHSPVEMTGLYWHFVDIIWIFLFPLLYLIGRHGPGVGH